MRIVPRALPAVLVALAAVARPPTPPSPLRPRPPRPARQAREARQGRARCRSWDRRPEVGPVHRPALPAARDPQRARVGRVGRHADRLAGRRGRPLVRARARRRRRAARHVGAVRLPGQRTKLAERRRLRRAVPRVPHALPMGPPVLDLERGELQRVRTVEQAGARGPVVARADEGMPVLHDPRRDLHDTPSMVGWTRRFLKTARRQPVAWGIHNYVSVNRLQTKPLTDLLATVKGRVWLTRDRRPGQAPQQEPHQAAGERGQPDARDPVPPHDDRPPAADRPHLLLPVEQLHGDRQLGLELRRLRRPHAPGAGRAERGAARRPHAPPALTLEQVPELVAQIAGTPAAG